MKLQKLKSEELAQLETLSSGDIQVTQVDGQVTQVSFPSPLGTLYLTLNNYSVTVNRRAIKKQFTVGFFQDVAGEKMFYERHFEHESDRENFISQHLFGVERSELAFTENEVYE